MNKYKEYKHASISLYTNNSSKKEELNLLTSYVYKLRPNQTQDLKMSKWVDMLRSHFNVRIQVFDWGIREGMKKSQHWADRASRKKAIALLH